MDVNTERERTLSSLWFKFLERSGSQVISFIIQIILARLLTPADYGVVALIVVFINISQVFVQSGLNTALIQNKEIDNVDYSSVFFISLGISVVLYVTLFACAPLVAAFYSMPELSAVMRVQAIILIPGAFNSIQNAIVEREMLFRKLMWSTICATAISGAAGIFAAYHGYGIWALVGQQLLNQVAVCVLLWFLVKWRPAMRFDISRAKTLFSFGWKLLCSRLIDTVNINLRQLVIGRVFDAGSLGYYNRGRQFPEYITNNINGSIQTVMLPTLSRYQDDKARVKTIMRRAVVTSSFVIFPLMVGLAVIAEPLVSLVLTDVWLPAVPFLQINCFIYAFRPVHTANLQAINAQGRSDVFLKLEIIKKVYSIIILCITVFFFRSPLAIAMGGMVSTMVNCVVNASPNKKLLDYGYLEQMSDILPSMAIALFMGACVYTILWLRLSPFVTILIQVAVGAFVYTAIAWITKIECFLYLKSILLDYISAIKKRMTGSYATR